MEFESLRLFLRAFLSNGFVNLLVSFNSFLLQIPQAINQEHHTSLAFSMNPDRIYLLSWHNEMGRIIRELNKTIA